MDLVTVAYWNVGGLCYQQQYSSPPDPGYEFESVKASLEASRSQLQTSMSTFIVQKPQ